MGINETIALVFGVLSGATGLIVASLREHRRRIGELETVTARLDERLKKIEGHDANAGVITRETHL